MSNEEHIITFSVNADGAIKASDQFGNSIEQAGKKAEGSGQGFSKMQASIVTAATAITAGVAAFKLATGAISALAGSLVGIAKQGEALGSLRGYFDQLGGSAASIEKARQASLGLVSEMDLLQIANKGLLAGIPNLNENFDKIADAGARMANALNISAKDGVERLTTAIAQGRPRQLEQLGIIIDQQKAYRDYAASAGIAVEQMSEMQKRAAMQSAAFQELNTFLEDTEAVSDSVANAYDSLTNQLNLNRQELGVVINENENLTGAIRELEFVVSQNSELWERLATILANFVADAIRGALVLFEGIPIVLQKVSDKIIEVLEWFRKLGERINEFGAKWLPNFTKGVKVAAAGVQELASQVGDGATSAMDGLIGTLVEGQKETRAYNAEVAASKKALNEASTEVKNFTDRQGTLEGRINASTRQLASQNKEVEKQVEGWKKLIDLIDDITGISARSQGIKKLEEDFKSVFQEQTKVTVQSKEMADAIKALKAEFRETGGAAEDFASSLQSALSNLPDKIEIQTSLLDNVFDKIFGLDNVSLDEKQIADQLSSALAQGISEIGGLLSSALLGDSKITGAQIGSTLGLLGGSIIGSMAKSPQVGAAIGQAAGQLIGSFVDKLTQKTKNAETLARRAIESFINEALNENKLTIKYGDNYIDFSRIILPNKKDFSSGMADTMIQGLQEAEPEIFSTYSAVFGALGEQITGSFEDGVKVGAVLMEAFGGSVDNLRLLVFSLGLSFEELEEAIVSAWLKGEIGALEAQSALRDLPKAFEPGLEAFGNIEGAIDNLIASAGRGTSAFKAIRDLGQEAVEAQVKDLDGLRAYLLASGKYTEDQINKLMKALADAGVGSMDQLVNANENLAIAILSSLEAQGGFFQDMSEKFDEAVTKAEAVESALDKIDGKNVNASVTINVKTNYVDSGSQDAMNQLRGGGAPGLPA